LQRANAKSIHARMDSEVAAARAWARRWPSGPGWPWCAAASAACGLAACGGSAPPAGEDAQARLGTTAAAIAEAPEAGQRDPVCVEPGRYTVTDGVVTDTQNGGRLWERRPTARLPQPDAVRYCASLVVEGIEGWHLPAPAELSTLRFKPGGLFGGHEHYCVPSIDQEAFPDTPSDLFWTSRTMPDGTAWYIGFDDGRSHRDDQTDRLWVRCAHDP
jgi:hypothetical protein